MKEMFMVIIGLDCFGFSAGQNWRVLLQARFGYRDDSASRLGSAQFASVPQTYRATAKPLRVSSRSLSPFGLEILTS
jgi:hypothetical protein